MGKKVFVIKLPLIDVLVMFSCHVVALCTRVLHTACVYLCVLFGMSCYGMYAWVADRQTNKPSVLRGGRRNLETILQGPIQPSIVTEV